MGMDPNVRSRMLSILPLVILSADSLPMNLPKRLTKQPYTPCKGCGQPARGGHCFKCQQKETENLTS